MDFSSEKDQRNIIFLSYEVGVPASCPAEWAEDKLYALRALGFRVHLITTPTCQLADSEWLRVSRSFSISKNDFYFEKSRLPDQKQLKWGWVIPWLVANTFGRLFDASFKMAAGSNSQGRYSWTLPALLNLLLLRCKYPGALVVATGGATSAHLAAVTASLLGGQKPIIEFQDPLIGDHMTISPLAESVLVRLERFLLLRSGRSVFVTQKARAEAIERNPDLSQIVQAIYPGAWPRNHESIPPIDIAGDVVEFLHLGTLYGSRNLDVFFSALDSLYEARPDLRGKIKVTNLGYLSVSSPETYLARSDFESLEAMPRDAALARASKSSFLLLIQHDDPRSENTIPYKTYDYLNLGQPIFALLRNPELAELIIKAGGKVAANADLSAQFQGISELLAPADPILPKPVSRASRVNILSQTRSLLGIEK